MTIGQAAEVQEDEEKVMGLRGPAPKPSEARLRRNGDYAPITKVDAAPQNVAPWEPDDTWPPLVIEIYESYAQSGQSALFELSDWAKVYFMCEAIAREIRPQFIGFSETIDPGTGMMEKKPLQARVPIKGASLSAINTMMTSLLTTEADRRRLSIELRRGEAEPEQSAGDKAMAAVTDILTAKAKRRASGDPS